MEWPAIQSLQASGHKTARHAERVMRPLGLSERRDASRVRTRYPREGELNRTECDVGSRQPSTFVLWVNFSRETARTPREETAQSAVLRSVPVLIHSLGVG
jgi:hypothetical protein